MKIVAVSQRIDFIKERNEYRDALDQRLCVWLSSLGFVPVAVPNTLNELANTTGDQGSHGVSIWLDVIRPDAIVLSGGNDLGEYPVRDSTETGLILWARENKLPLLGICRGMQMMGVWCGVKLHPVFGHAKTRHFLQGIIQQEVNSYHNFALSDCPVGFEVLAHSEDGEIEAIRHRDLPWEGWMWHPEREEEPRNSDISRLKALFDR